MLQGERKMHAMFEALAGVRRLLIMAHDNPDPDGIASAWVLAHVLRRQLGLEVTVAYEGVVGRAENRAMVDLLQIPLVPLADVKLQRMDATALVDAQPRTGNASLPGNLPLQIVIDHHPLRMASRAVPFCDVRSDYGATATIVAEHWFASRLPLRPRLATALFYAIRSETQNLGRDASNPDLRAFMTLFPRINNRTIAGIEQAPLSRRYLALLSSAFSATRLYGDLSLTTLGRMPYPDVPAELADLLLRIDEVRCTLVMGIYGDAIYLSIRMEHPRGDAARVLRRVVGEFGKSGGHSAMAGGKIVPREAGRPAAQIMRGITVRAREVLGVAGLRGRPILRQQRRQARRNG